MAGRQILFNKKENEICRQDQTGRIVAVVGAGVAGMTAAKVLAERGFCPIVFEKGKQAGGQLNWADKPPHKEQLGQMVLSLQKQLAKLGVKIKFETMADVRMLRELNPYAVIVATGAVPLRPQSVSGINLPQVLTVAELFDNKAIVDKKVILVGSGAAGLEVAEYLCVNGNRLTIVEMQDEIGKGVYAELYTKMMERLARYDICYLPSHRLVGVEPQSVIVEDLTNGSVQKLITDYTVLTMGVCPVNSLVSELKPFFCKVFAVGDAVKPGRVADAVRSALFVASGLE